MKPPPLAWGVGAGLLIAALLAPVAVTALDELAAARSERARWAAATAAPEGRRGPLVARGLAIEGDSTVLAARIRERARNGGVLVEALDALPGDGELVVVRLRLSGPEKAVLALVDSLEREAPLIRLRGWRIVAIDRGVRLTGDAVAARR
jgi:hypothetical protein